METWGWAILHHTLGKVNLTGERVPPGTDHLFYFSALYSGPQWLFSLCPLYVAVWQGDWGGLAVSISREHKGDKEEKGMTVDRSEPAVVCDV